MDEMADSFESANKDTEIKLENVWCNSSTSPLNSISVTSRLNCNNSPEEDSSSCENASPEMLTDDGDVLLVDIEIGGKKIENIPVKCECPLEDLAKEFAENETVKVVYFLNEKITKGGRDCDVADAQVMVKLKPTWKWLPVEEIVEDPCVTVQEVFGDLLDHFKLVFGLAPKVQRTTMAQPSSVPLSSTSTSEDQFTVMLAELKAVLTSHPILDMFNNKDAHSEKDFTSEGICHGLSQAKTKELKGLLLKLNSLLNSHHQGKPIQKPTLLHCNSTHTDQPNQYPFQSHTSSTSSDTSLLNYYATDRDVSMATMADQGVAPLSRLRTQFDPHFEVPRLKEWFEENPIPSRYMISNMVNQLNAEEIRQGKQPVTDRAVYIWFKNTRARKFKKKSPI